MKRTKFWRLVFSLILIFGILISSINPRPVIAQDAAQADTGINGSPFVLFENGRYHMWYSVDEELYYASSNVPDNFSNGTPVVITGNQPGSKANPAIIREGASLYMFLSRDEATNKL